MGRLEEQLRRPTCTVSAAYVESIAEHFIGTKRVSRKGTAGGRTEDGMRCACGLQFWDADETFDPHLADQAIAKLVSRRHITPEMAPTVRAAFLDPDAGAILWADLLTVAEGVGQ